MRKVGYAEAREYIDTGDVILFHGHSLLGTLIQLKSKYWTHIGIAINLPQFEGAEKRRWLAESIAAGPSLSLLSKRVEEYSGVVAWAPLKNFTTEQRNSIGSTALKYMGVAGYDYFGLFAQLMSRPKVEDHDVICSEYFQVAMGMQGKVLRPDEVAKLPYFHEILELVP
jgi:hypothetical protein